MWFQTDIFVRKLIFLLENGNVTNSVLLVKARSPLDFCNHI